jgi:hypothetical protein
MPRGSPKRRSCYLPLLFGAVVVGGVLPVWFGGLFVPPPSSLSGSLTDAQLKNLVKAQNATISKLSSVVQALHRHEGSDISDTLSDILALGAHSSSSGPFQQEHQPGPESMSRSQPSSSISATTASQQLPQGVSPELAESWCRAIHAAVRDD